MKSLFTIIILLFFVKVNFGQVFDNDLSYTKYAPELLRQDLDFIFKKYEEVHPNFYEETPKDIVEKRLEKLKAAIVKPMTRMDFISLFAPVLFNIVTDGHNYVNDPDEESKIYKKKGGLFFPLPIKISNKKIYCNTLKGAIPFNSEIISINDISAKDIVNKILGCYKAENEIFAETLNSPGFSWSYWNRYGGFQDYKIEYNENGSSDIIKIIKGLPDYKIEKLRIAIPKKNYAFTEIPELKTGIIQFKVCEDLEHFKPFCDSVFTIIKKKAYNNLVIDIRENTGGTTRLGEILYGYLIYKPIAQFDKIEYRISKEKRDEFIKMNKQYAGWFKWYNYLYYPIYIRTNASRKIIMTSKIGALATQSFKPKKPKSSPLLFNGKVYLLTSEKTYSSAAIFAATFKNYNLGTIVGQETGEPTVFTANTVDLVMPNTKLVCSASCARIFLIGWKKDGHGIIPDVIIREANNSVTDEELEYVKYQIKGQ